MSRYERRVYFDRLCSLRDAYQERSADDRTSAISADDVIRWAEELLDAAETAIEAAPQSAETSNKADQTA
jgi:hypothetical protein